MLLKGPDTRGNFELAEAVDVNLGLQPDSLKITIPIGFKTDFASIPWFAQGIVRKFGAFNAAAVIHDYLYDTRLVDRPVADAIFLQEMKRAKVHWLKSRAMYWAVSIFGRKWYDT